MGLTNEQKNARDRVTQKIPTFTSEGKEKYVFISYKSDDWEKVLGKIVRHMVDTYGLRVYFDKNFDRDNDSWVSNMTSAIRTGKCCAILAFVSKQYMISYACLMELLTARGYSAFMDHDQDRENKLQIFPIIVDDSRDLKDSVSSSGKKVTMSDAEWNCYLELLEEASECPWVTGSEKLKNQINYLKKMGKKNVTEEHISKTAELILSEGHERYFSDGVEGTSYYSALYVSIRKYAEKAFDPALIRKPELAANIDMVQETRGDRTDAEARETGERAPSVPVATATELAGDSAWNRDPIRVFRRKFEQLSERYKEEWKRNYTGNTPAIEMSLRIELQIPEMSQDILSGKNLKALFRDLMNLIYQSYGETYFAPAAERCIAAGNGYPLIITDAFYSSEIEDKSRYNRVEHSDYHFFNSYSARDLVKAMEKQLEMLFHFLRDRGTQVSPDDVTVEYRFEDSEVRALFARVEEGAVKADKFADGSKAKSADTKAQTGSASKLEYWQGFCDYVKSGQPHSALRMSKAADRSWHAIHLDRSLFSIECSVNTQNNSLRTAFIIQDSPELFARAEEKRQLIDSALQGLGDITWDGKVRAAKVYIITSRAGMSTEEQYAWFWRTAQAMYQTIRPHLDR